MQEIPDNIDLDAVYREYANLVYRFLYAHIHDAEWAQELMQETFLRAIDSINRYDGSCKLSTWLCQIARHIMYQELRKKNRAELVELEEYLPDQRAPDGEENVIRRERRLELYRAVHHLPEAEREVVLYRITADLSFREIGEILGKNENWSRTTFYRAKQKIKKELNTHE
ncbi:MAG: sigma-70 family RNA polymerase sigma factor [Lachnospiraceae bacterium]|jgi:RNA polymerase sigma factor (sigma-70 family)|nr:sigma-70 family RNA polymerase sigma factor [Lachnospiraceae bacterium]